MRGRRSAITALLIAGLCVFVAACGDSGDKSTSGSSTSSGASEQKQYKIAMVTALSGASEFVDSQVCGAREAAKELGVKLSVQGPKEFSAPQQVQVTNAVAATKPDAIAINVNDDSALRAPLKQASAQGAKVVLMDTLLKQGDFVSAAVVSNNIQGGELAGKTMGELIGGSGSVLTVSLNPGLSSLDDRVEGFQKGIAAAGLKDLGVQYSTGDVAKASSIVAAALTKTPDLAGIFVPDGASWQGVINALRRAGKLGDVKLVAFDASSDKLKAMDKGEIQAIVSQNIGEQGRRAIQLAVKALGGENVSTEPILIDTGVIKPGDDVSSPEIAPLVFGKC